MDNDEYKTGYLAGIISGMRTELSEHKEDTRKQFEEYAKIQRLQQKLTWMILGAIAWMQLGPQIKLFLGIGV